MPRLLLIMPSAPKQLLPLTMEPSAGHVIKYYKDGDFSNTWKLTDYICRLCICPYVYAF